MTYNTNLQNTEIQTMTELYNVTYGNSVEYFTNSKTEVVFNNKTYIPIPVQRTNISKDVEMRTQTFTVTTIPTDLFKQYIAATPVEPVNITLYRALNSDVNNEYALIFTGVVKSVQFAKGQVAIECVANAQYLRKKIPPYLYQSFCNHTLFDTRCTLDKTAYAVAATLTYVSGTTIKSAAFATKVDGWFNQGYIELGDNLDKRLIISHTGDTCILHIAFDARVAAGLTMTAYPGCDKKPDTCKNKFNNYTNALVHPLIPTRNPVLQGYL